MIIFDGRAFAVQKEHELIDRVQAFYLTYPAARLRIVALLFTEDEGSVLYTRLKQAAAERVGIVYSTELLSVHTPTEEVITLIQQYNQDETVTGIIVQKPAKKTWTAHRPLAEYHEWWEQLVAAISPKKDVDGLHPDTIACIQLGENTVCVLPATCRAVVSIMNEYPDYFAQSFPLEKKVIIIGKSDLLGIPLYHYLQSQQYKVELLGSAELSRRIHSGQKLTDAAILISATGKQHLITGNLLSENVAIIDVGEPKPDVDRDSVAEKAAFLTPVPRGVGPLTVISLLENCLILGLQAEKLKTANKLGE